MYLGETTRLNCLSCSTELINDYIFEFEIDTKQLYISKDWKKLMGYSEFDVQNSFAGLTQILADAPRFKQNFENYLYATEKEMSAENQYRCADGSYRWFSEKYRKVKFNNLQHTHRVVVFYNDITELKFLYKKSQQELANKDALINTTTDLIFSMDSNYKLTAANSAYFETHRLSPLQAPFKIGVHVLDDLNYSMLQRNLWLDFYKRALNGESFTVEHNNLLPQELNKLRWFENTFNPIIDGGKVTGVAVYARDISERKSAEFELAKSEQRFRSMFKEHSATMLLIDPVTLQILDANGAARKLYGYSYERFFGMNLTEIYCLTPAEIRSMVVSMGAFPNNKLSCSHRTSTGEIKKVEVLSSLIEASNKNLFFSVITDVTEKSRIEDLLQIEKENFQSVVKALPDIIFKFDHKNRILFLHSNSLDDLVIDAEEAIGKQITDLFPGSFGSQIEQKIIETHQTSEVLIGEYALEIPKKGTRWFEARFVKASESGTVVVIRDITIQKSAALEIKNSNDRFDYVTKATSDGIYDWDIINNEFYCSDGFKSIFELEEVEDKYFLEMWQSRIHPDELPAVMESFQNFLKSKDTKWSIAYRLKTGNGELIDVTGKAYVIRDEKGNAVRMVGALSDVTALKKTESLLRENLKVISTVQNVASVGYIVADLASGSFNSNEIFDSITGIDPLLDKTLNGFNKLIEPSLVVELSEAFLQSMLNKKDLTQKFRIKNYTDDQIRWVNLFGQFVFNADDHPVQFIAAIQDITERENLIEQRKRILESITDHFFAIDANLNLLYCNKSALQFSKSMVGEIYGKNIFDIFPTLVATSFEANLQKALATNQHIEFDFFLNEEEGWFEQHFYPYEDGCTCLFKSINKRKTAERAEQLLNLKLAIRSEELSNSNMELERFAYVASHDLQEPLRMVTSYLQLFEKKYQDIVDEKGKKYIGFAVDGANRMKQLIKDLLQYSRAGAGSLEIVAVDMNEVMNDVLKLFNNEISKKQAAITFGNLPVIMAGATPMLQVMQNLVGNALKFCGSKKIQLNISCEENDLEWIFSIRDNGIGIDLQFADKIFIIFQRLHTKDEYSGSGIGLSICKKIIDRYKGKIWVESELGAGANFLFSIPKIQVDALVEIPLQNLQVTEPTEWSI